MKGGIMSNSVHAIFQPILAAIDGRLCDHCSERAAAEWSWLRHAPKYAVMPPDDEYHAELRDAGRLTRGVP